MEPQAHGLKQSCSTESTPSRCSASNNSKMNQHLFSFRQSIISPVGGASGVGTGLLVDPEGRLLCNLTNASNLISEPGYSIASHGGPPIKYKEGREPAMHRYSYDAEWPEMSERIRSEVERRANTDSSAAYISKGQRISQVVISSRGEEKPSQYIIPSQTGKPKQSPAEQFPSDIANPSHLSSKASTNPYFSYYCYADTSKRKGNSAFHGTGSDSGSSSGSDKDNYVFDFASSGEPLPEMIFKQPRERVLAPSKRKPTSDFVQRIENLGLSVEDNTGPQYCSVKGPPSFARIREIGTKASLALSSDSSSSELSNTSSTDSEELEINRIIVESAPGTSLEEVIDHKMTVTLRGYPSQGQPNMSDSSPSLSSLSSGSLMNLRSRLPLSQQWHYRYHSPSPSPKTPMMQPLSLSQGQTWRPHSVPAPPTTSALPFLSSILTSTSASLAAAISTPASRPISSTVSSPLQYWRNRTSPSSTSSQRGTDSPISLASSFSHSRLSKKFSKKKKFIVPTIVIHPDEEDGGPPQELTQKDIDYLTMAPPPPLRLLVQPRDSFVEEYDYKNEVKEDMVHCSETPWYGKYEPVYDQQYQPQPGQVQEQAQEQGQGQEQGLETQYRYHHIHHHSCCNNVLEGNRDYSHGEVGTQETRFFEECGLGSENAFNPFILDIPHEFGIDLRDNLETGYEYK
ncbi:hypothetical protein BX616_008665 [Lobosporangium transversale]|nr:hypothetical protein BX616_008665 [Lobosporangium transversale]